MSKSINKTTIASLNKDIVDDNQFPLELDIRLDAEWLESQGEVERARFYQNIVIEITKQSSKKTRIIDDTHLRKTRTSADNYFIDINVIPWNNAV